jgi:hypothetical protein
MVEIIIALAILTMGVCVVYDRFLDSARHGRELTSELQARYLAMGELDHLRACPFDRLRAWTPPAKPAIVPDRLRFSCLERVTPRPDGLLELSVQVGWNLAANGDFVPGQSVTVKGVKVP